MITIWDEVLFKLRVSFDVMVISKKVLLESSNLIETYINVVVEVIKAQSSVSFDFCIDEDFV